MCGTQLLASATALMRGQILPPSEMKSLYGSTTRRAVICFHSLLLPSLLLEALNASALARHHWHDLESDNIGPAGYPALRQRLRDLSAVVGQDERRRYAYRPIQ